MCHYSKHLEDGIFELCYKWEYLMICVLDNYMMKNLEKNYETIQLDVDDFRAIVDECVPQIWFKKNFLNILSIRQTDISMFENVTRGFY